MTDRDPQPVSPTRRKVLKGIAAGVGAGLGPWVPGPRAAAADAEVNVLMWADSLPSGFLAAFTAETGIKVNLTAAGSNREILNKMKASGGRGFDICGPTNVHAPQWAKLDLLQPVDHARLKRIGNLDSRMREVGEREWNFNDEGAHWLPHIWATEGIAWRSDLWKPPHDGEVPSYGDCWQPDVAGKVMIRPHSGMLGAGLYLESIGALEAGAMRRSHSDEKTMRDTWQLVTDFCIKHKSQIKFFWNDPASQRDGLLNSGVLVGQAWDGPVIELMNEGRSVQYRAPLEGALTWVDGLAISAEASDLDAVYAFLDYCLRPEPAGRAIDGGGDPAYGGHGYNSAVAGAEQHATADYRRTFESVFPKGSLDELWLWPPEPRWYIDVRTEFRDEFFNA